MLSRQASNKNIGMSPRSISNSSNQETTASTSSMPYHLIKELNHPTKSKIASISFSSRYLAVGSEDGCLNLYSVSKWELIETSDEFKLRSKIRIVRFSTCGRYLGVGCDNGKVMVIDFKMLKMTGGKITLDGTNSTSITRNAIIHAIAFRPDEDEKHTEEFALGGFDGIVGIATLPAHDTIYLKEEISRLGVILSLDYSPCGKYLAIGASDKSVTLVDSYTLTNIAELNRTTIIQCVQWKLLGNSLCLAAGGRDGIVAIYKLESNKNNPAELNCTLIHKVAPARLPNRVLCLGWNHDNTYLVSAGTDEFATVFSIVGNDFKLKQEIQRAASTHTTCAAFEQHFLALGGKDCKISIYGDSKFISLEKTKRPLMQKIKSAMSVTGGSNIRNSMRLSGITKSSSLRDRRASAGRVSLAATKAASMEVERRHSDTEDISLLRSPIFSMTPRTWTKKNYSQPLKFLQKSEVFLNNKEMTTSITASLSSSSNGTRMALISFVTSVLMLRHYLQRIRALEDEATPLVYDMKEDCQFIDIICYTILRSSILIMDEITEQLLSGKSVSELRHSIHLQPQDIDRIRLWNEKWKHESFVKNDIPFLDIDLLQSVDASYTKDDNTDPTASLSDNMVSASVVSLDTIEESMDKSVTSKETIDNMSISTQHFTWEEVKDKVPKAFSITCKTFLKAYELESPPSYLRSFVSAVLMLHCHLQFIHKKGDDRGMIDRINNEKKALKGFISLLKIFNCAMEKEIETPTEDLNSILKLNLSKDDFMLIHRWNNIFRIENESFLPLVDIGLIENILEDLREELGEDSKSVQDLDDCLTQYYQEITNSDLYQGQSNDEKIMDFLNKQLHPESNSQSSHSLNSNSQNGTKTHEEHFTALLWSQSNFVPASDEATNPALALKRHVTRRSFIQMQNKTDMRRASFSNSKKQSGSTRSLNVNRLERSASIDDASDLRGKRRSFVAGQSSPQMGRASMKSQERRISFGSSMRGKSLLQQAQVERERNMRNNDENSQSSRGSLRSSHSNSFPRQSSSQHYLDTRRSSMGSARNAARQLQPDVNVKRERKSKKSVIAVSHLPNQPLPTYDE